MKLKKIVALSMAAAIVLTVSSCGKDKENNESTGSNQSGGSGEIGEITLWNLSWSQEYGDQTTAEFNEAHPGTKITASYRETDAHKDALKIAASSGTLPDMWFNWGGALGSFYAENNLAYDLTDYATENNWDEIFTSAALDLCTLDGKLSGYPSSFNALSVYYRKDIFDKYGISEPTTFEEFEQVCATLKENGEVPMATGGMNGWHLMRWVEQLIEHFAGAELHDKMNVFDETYDNDATVQALTKYKEWADKGYFPLGFITANPDETKDVVLRGDAVMTLEIQAMDNTILENEQDINNYGTFPFPSGGNNRMSAFVDLWQFNANLSDEKLDACVSYLDFVSSDELVKANPGKYNLPLPKIGSVAREEAIHTQGVLDDANANGTFTITDQAFPAEVADKLFNAQDGIANGQMTPEEGAALIQKGIEDYVSKN